MGWSPSWWAITLSSLVTIGIAVMSHVLSGWGATLTRFLINLPLLLPLKRVALKHPSYHIPMIITCFMGNELWNIGKKKLRSITDKKEKKKILQERLFQSFFYNTQTQQTKMQFNLKQFELRASIVHLLSLVACRGLTSSIYEDILG